MRKAVIAVAGVAALGAAGWSAAWHAGKGEIEIALAAEIESLRAAGFEVAYDGGAIGGFPLAYEARYENVRLVDPYGRAADLPWLLARSGVTDAGRVSIHLPETFTASLPMPQAVGMEFGTKEGETPAEEDTSRVSQPQIVVVDVEADALVLTTDGTGSAANTVDATARSLLIVSGGADQPLSASFELVGFDGSLTMPAGETGEATARASIDKLDYAIVQVDPSGMQTTSEGMSDRLLISGRTDLLNRDAFDRFLSGEDRSGTIEVSWQAGQTVSQMTVGGSTGPGPDAEPQADEDAVTAEGEEPPAPLPNLDGVATQSAGTSGGLFRVADGQIDVRISAETNRMNLAPLDEAAPVRGEIVLDSLETVYLAPISPSEEMKDFRIRIAAQGLELDDSFWALVDPGETLERGRADLVFEVGGTGRLVGAPEGEAKPMGRDAIELGNVEIAVAELNALGASLKADGAVEFLQPLNLPTGRITVKTRNIVELAQSLQALGLIDERTFQMTSLLASVYTKAGESEEERVSEIVFADSGITINELPVR